MGSVGHVLITGGAGFIGCALARLLVEDGWQVVAFDNLHPQIHPTRQRPRQLDSAVTLVEGDVTNRAAVSEVVESHPFSLVVHLAAETGTAQSLTESTRHTSVNVVGTSVLMDAFLAKGELPEHVVLSSSRAIYGEGAWRSSDGHVAFPPPRSHERLARGIWQPELPACDGWEPVPSEAGLVVPNPASVYGATKLAQENLLDAWCGSLGVRLSVFRLQNVYGPGQAPTNPYTGILTLFHRIAAAGGQIEVYEDGEIGRDFVLIDDVAAALLAGVRSVHSSGTRIFDVGTGVATTIWAAAAAIAEMYGAPKPRISGAFRDGDIRWAQAANGPLESEFGSREVIDFAEGSRRLASWLKEEKIT